MEKSVSDVDSEEHKSHEQYEMHGFPNDSIEEVVQTNSESQEEEPGRKLYGLDISECALYTTIPEIEQHLLKMKERQTPPSDRDMFQRYWDSLVDLRSRQLNMLKPLLKGWKEQTNKEFMWSQSGNNNLIADLWEDVAIARTNPEFRDLISTAYSIYLPPMLQFWGQSKETEELPKECRISIHGGSRSLVQACIGYIFHYHIMLVNPPNDVGQKISEKFFNSSDVPLPFQISHIKSCMHGDWEEKFDENVARWEHDLDALVELATQEYTLYAIKVAQSFESRYNNFLEFGHIEATKAARLIDEHWKDPGQLSLKSVDILRSVILAIECLFTQQAGISTDRPLPPQRVWGGAKEYYGHVLYKKGRIVEQPDGTWA